MQDTFIRQIVYTLSQIKEAELVNSEETDYNKDNSSEVNVESEFTDS